MKDTHYSPYKRNAGKPWYREEYNIDVVLWVVYICLLVSFL